MGSFVKFTRGAAFGLAVAMAPLSATAQDYTLTISSWTPMGAPMNAIMWPKLIEMMEEATDGRVTAEIKLNLAAPPAQFDLILDGAADMSWIFHGYNPGKYVTTQMIELPGYDAPSSDLSAAYWNTYEEHLYQAGEHDGVKVIGLMVHGPGQLNTVNKVETLADAEGLKLRSGGGVATRAAEEIGAVAMNVPSPKLYETLASNVADGTMSPIESRKTFNLIEVTPYVYEMPGGFYRGSFGIIMNQDTFDGFPEDIQEALMTVFGETTSRLGGEMWDQIDLDGRTLTESTEGNEFVTASAEDQETWSGMVTTIAEGVLADIDATGVDATAAYEFLKAQIDQATQ